MISGGIRSGSCVFLPFIRIANRHIVCDSIEVLFFEKDDLLLLKFAYGIGSVILSRRSDAVREFFK